MDYPTCRLLLIIFCGVAFAVFCSVVAYSCMVVGARADRLSERIVKAMADKRIEDERLDEIARAK